MRTAVPRIPSRGGTWVGRSRGNSASLISFLGVIDKETSTDLALNVDN
jgi:hypothetical protein